MAGSTSTDDRDWQEHIVRTVHEHPELQAWASHLGVRLPEIRDLVGRARSLRPEPAAGARCFGDLLEVGCGNALGSACFSPLARKIVATDLEAPDHRGAASHAIGLERARSLIAAVGAENVEVRAASAEELPFGDATFDAILSMHTFEHLPRLDQALKECLRVLRPGGHLIASVPATGWSLTYPLAFYLELGGRAIERLVLQRFRSKAPRRSSGASRPAEPSAEPVVRDWASFRKAYPQFPLPTPHGESPSWFAEVWDLRPARWVTAIRDAGFEAVEAHAMSVVPRALLRIPLGGLEPALYERLESYDRALSRAEPALPIAQVVALLARKPAIDR